MNQNREIIIFHSSDFDGKCAAAIAQIKFPGATLYGYNHYQEINWDLIYKHKVVVMVDISFNDIADMKTLRDSFDFIWIDHHITAIEKYAHLDIQGIQRVGIGACSLVWEFFFEEYRMPLAIELLANYDVFNLSDNALHFQYGLRRTGIEAIDLTLWKKIFYDSKTFDKIMSDGKICYEAEVESNKYKVKSSFIIDNFHGYRAIAINSTPGSSLIFDSIDDSNIDIKIIFGYSGKLWNVSMYSNNEPDVSKIALLYSGGGHKSAAGYCTDIDTMIKLGLIK